MIGLCKLQRIQKDLFTVTMNATTGNSGEFHPDLKKIEYIKSFKNSCGCWIWYQNPEHVKDIASVADGIVVVVKL